MLFGFLGHLVGGLDGEGEGEFAGGGEGGNGGDLLGAGEDF